MEKTIINKYLLTDDVIAKQIKAIWKKYVLLNIIVDVLFLLFIMRLYLKYKINSLLIYVLFGVLMFCLVFFKRNRAIKTEIERTHIRYGEEAPYMTIEINEKINITAKDNTMDIPFDKVTKLTDTKDFLMIQTKGKMCVMLKKDSFVKGTCEECAEKLKK